jgi:hypothetical protein
MQRVNRSIRPWLPQGLTAEWTCIAVPTIPDGTGGMDTAERTCIAVPAIPDERNKNTFVALFLQNGSGLRSMPGLGGSTYFLGESWSSVPTGHRRLSRLARRRHSTSEAGVGRSGAAMCVLSRWTGWIGPGDLERIAQLVQKHRVVSSFRGARGFPAPKELVQRRGIDSRIGHDIGFHRWITCTEPSLSGRCRQCKHPVADILPRDPSVAGPAAGGNGARLVAMFLSLSGQFSRIPRLPVLAPPVPTARSRRILPPS